MNSAGSPAEDKVLDDAATEPKVAPTTRPAAEPEVVEKRDVPKGAIVLLQWWSVPMGLTIALLISGAIPVDWQVLWYSLPQILVGSLQRYHLVLLLITFLLFFFVAGSLLPRLLRRLKWTALLELVELPGRFFDRIYVANEVLVATAGTFLGLFSLATLGRFRGTELRAFLLFVISASAGLLAILSSITPLIRSKPAGQRSAVEGAAGDAVVEAPWWTMVLIANLTFLQSEMLVLGFLEALLSAWFSSASF